MNFHPDRIMRAKRHLVSDIGRPEKLADAGSARYPATALAVVLVASLCLPSGAGAEESPPSFSLPTPGQTPTPSSSPTPVPTGPPQGPADELAGVPIGPRLIRPQTQQQTAPAETLDAAEDSEAPPTTPADTPVDSPAGTASEASRTTAATSQPERAPAAPPPAPIVAAETVEAEPVEAEPGRRAPAQQTAPAQTPSELAPDPSLQPASLTGDADAQGWYDIESPAGVDAQPALGDVAPSLTNAQIAQSEAQATRNVILAGLAILVLLTVLLAFMFWRRRSSEALMLEGPGTALTSAVRQAMPRQSAQTLGEMFPETDESDATPSLDYEASAEEDWDENAPLPKPAFAMPRTPEPTIMDAGPPFDPAQIDLSAEVISANRSMMMFMAEVRLDVLNRASHAVRGLDLYASLACAQRGTADENALVSASPLAQIDRIGPNQSRRITAHLQLPLGEVTALRQGAKPLFIPLLHIALAGTGPTGAQARFARSFVLGTPSAASHARLHPLPLDGPPGSLPGLRAQVIKPQTSDAQSA